MTHRAALVALALAAISATAATATAPTAPADLAGLEAQLDSDGADRVNAALGSTALADLARRTAACELPAVSLAVRLARSRDAPAATGHRDALRSATGGCMPFVLALTAPDEIPRLCASLEGWGPAQTARELRRRMAAIDAHAVLRSSARGKACRAAYLYELENTRVVLKGRPR